MLNDYTIRHYRRYYNAQQAGNDQQATDSLWRIASHNDLLSDLNPNGTLTEAQRTRILDWITRNY